MSKIKVNEIEKVSGSGITIPTGTSLTVTDGLAASTISSGTLADARLPTVPVSKGGTGLTSLGSAGQVVKVNSGASALEFGDAGGGLESVQAFTTAGTHTYTKPSGINKIRVFITGGGGAGGGNTNSGYGYQIGQGGAAGGTAIKFLDASSITTVTVTIGAGGAGQTGSSGGSNGSTSSFGSHCSATGGEGGDAPGALGGTQSGGGHQLFAPVGHCSAGYQTAFVDSSRQKSNARAVPTRL